MGGGAIWRVAKLYYNAQKVVLQRQRSQKSALPEAAFSNLPALAVPLSAVSQRKGDNSAMPEIIVPPEIGPA